ncbi:MAG: enoyl-CoA hydratase [Ilumatobacter sp.]|nr:enoyl-CoA hydratase [Ilumatobacter sp.]
MAELVRFDLAPSTGVATITLDSPHNRNALSRQLVRELADAIARAEHDDARAIVLTHDGPAFCAGADLKERPTDSAGGGVNDGTNTSAAFVEIMTRLMETPRPTIAAVRGAVRAGGIGLMASCDLVVVESSVSFALTEVRIGVAPAIISVPILRRVPAAQIAAAMLTGEPFDADRAREMGLVTHVTDDVTAQIDELCAGIAAGAPRAVAETKRLLHHVPRLDAAPAFVEMQALSDELFRGPDAAEGMAAFRERRPPAWADQANNR